MLFSFAIIFILGVISGKIFEKMNLPKLVGMIFIGILIGKNGLNIIDDSLLEISPILRQVALIIILTRAGFSLNFNDLKKVGSSAILISFIPATFEIISITITSVLFFKVSVLEGILLGSVIAAVSPAIIVPRMIKIIDKGYRKAPCQTILAGASIDDIFVIILFSTILSFLQGEGVNLKSFLFIPLTIILGALLGVIFGVFLYKIIKNEKIEIKLIYILSFSFILVYIEELTKNTIPISGLVGIMTMGMYFTKKDVEFSKDISNVYNKIWGIAEILLFVLIGTIVSVKYAIMFGALAIIVISIALIFRILGVYLSLYKSKFNKKEKLFCAISYLPKATVQASIGSIPLTYGLACGELVLTMSVLSILITAPLGAILIDKTYNKLLK